MSAHDWFLFGWVLFLTISVAIVNYRAAYIFDILQIVNRNTELNTVALISLSASVESRELSSSETRIISQFLTKKEPSNDNVSK